MSKLKSFLKYWLPVVICMAVIFSASGDTKSASRSSRLIEPFIRWFFPDASQDQIWPIVMVVRKCAHLTEYAVLALLLWHAFRGLSKQAEGWSWRVAACAWLGVVLYAITDEVHQAFVPNRMGSPWDVLLDSIGGAAGLLALWAFGRWRKRWKPMSPKPGSED
ncbi:MAG TPA: VanZ family protein [Verrucomicrobiae bacterium]|nr:VanZ family protein [Verrucomicrobiae bacterium]